MYINISECRRLCTVIYDDHCIKQPFHKSVIFHQTRHTHKKNLHLDQLFPDPHNCAKYTGELLCRAALKDDSDIAAVSTMFGSIFWVIFPNFVSFSNPDSESIRGPYPTLIDNTGRKIYRVDQKSWRVEFKLLFPRKWSEAYKNVITPFVLVWNIMFVSQSTLLFKMHSLGYFLYK